MRFHWNRAALAAALVVLCASGCKGPDKDAATTVGSTGGAAASAGQTAPASPDDKLKEAVKAKFAADPQLKGETISIEVRDGRVYLEGTASSDAVRIQAENVAREVPDVFGVDAEKLAAK
jgi:osmotically-inducible protein OsmY